jgi:hypothetical protein
LSRFREHRFSMIAFCKALAVEVQNRLTLPDTPAFVDFDAVASFDDLPNRDFLGLVGFSMAYEEKLVRVFCGIGIGTWNDPDLVRLTEATDIVAERLRPEAQVPLYLEAATEPAWLAVAGPTEVPPIDRDGARALQLVSTTLVSSQSGRR